MSLASLKTLKVSSRLDRVITHIKTNPQVHINIRHFPTINQRKGDHHKICFTNRPVKAIFLMELRRDSALILQYFKQLARLKRKYSPIIFTIAQAPPATTNIFTTNKITMIPEGPIGTIRLRSYLSRRTASINNEQSNL